MKNNRRAISEIVTSLLLISIGVVGVGIVSSGMISMNFETISCEVQLLEIYEISDNEYFVEMILYNNGDYTINATVKYFDDITITNLEHDSLSEIRPANTSKVEFQFTGNGNIGESITMGFDVVNNSQETFCIKEVNV